MADRGTNACDATHPSKPAVWSGSLSPPRFATPPLAAARDVLLLINPKAGSGRGRTQADQAEALAGDRGFRVHRVGDRDQLTEQSTELARQGQLRAVIAVGGDGTVGMALNATPPDAPLIVLPAGTENLLSKYLRTGARASQIVGLLERGVTVKLDAGVANGRLFALMFSTGLDAEVVRRVHAQRTGNITHLAYAKPIIAALRRYQYPRIETTWTGPDGNQRQTVGRWVFGVNLPRYARGIPIAPQASGADGLLDLCVFERGGIARGFWYLWHVLRRRHRQVASITQAQTATLRVDSPAPDTPYQLDGDPGGVLPVDVSVAPGRLTVLVSRSTATRLGFAPQP